MIENPVYVGDEVVNGVPVRTYTFEVRSIGATSEVEVARSDGSYAIAVDGDYLVHYRLDLELRTGAEGDPEAQSSVFSLEVSLEDVNQPVEITFPPSCQAAELLGGVMSDPERMAAGPPSSVVTGRRRLRITLLTLGSRGDVEPYLGLGVALAQAGHRVTVAAPAAFEGLIRRAGVEAFLVEPDPRLRGRRKGAAALAAILGDGGGDPPAPRGPRPVGFGHQLFRLPGGQPACRCRPLPGLARSGRQDDRPDLRLPCPTDLPGADPSDARLSQPVLQPLVAPGMESDRATSWPSGWGGRRSNGVPNTWRSQVVGLAPTAIELLPPDGEVCLYGFCRSLLPPPPDWPPGVVVTGPWWLDAQEDWRPPEDLDRFLQDSGRVVFLGFGSMMDASAEEAKCRRRSGPSQARVPRGLARRSVPDSSDLPPSPRRLAVRDVPFDWLFRRVDAIVHHGGAGTTAQAARAGKPSVVVPFFGDQLFWGQRIHRAGGGPRPIPRRALTSERLVSAIDEALHDPGSAQRAAALGIRVRAETGLSTAVDLIEAACLG